MTHDDSVLVWGPYWINSSFVFFGTWLFWFWFLFGGLWMKAIFFGFFEFWSSKMGFGFGFGLGVSDESISLRKILDTKGLCNAKCLVSALVFLVLVLVLVWGSQTMTPIFFGFFAKTKKNKEHWLFFDPQTKTKKKTKPKKKQKKNKIQSQFSLLFLVLFFFGFGFGLVRCVFGFRFRLPLLGKQFADQMHCERISFQKRCIVIDFL